jgi:xylan 1,4-beta-xylosidase
MVYLCGRPLRNRGRCTLGRETAIQPMTWGADGWLRTVSGDGIPTVDVPAPAGVEPQSWPMQTIRRNFDEDVLPIDFQWLRTPRPEDVFSLNARRGHLRLYGRETIGSVFTQALVARRQQAHCFGASTIVEFEPQHFQQMAGLVCYYNSSKFHYFYISRDERGKHLRVMSALPDQVTADAFTPPIPVADGVPIELSVEVDYERLRFAYRIGEGSWQWLQQLFDASILSDEATAPGLANFTGAFVGMACQDLAGTAHAADFDWFEYRERDYVVEVTDAQGR